MTRWYTEFVRTKKENDMILDLVETHCCGVHEMEGICDHEPRKAVLAPCLEWHFGHMPYEGAGQVIFMDVKSDDPDEHPRYSGRRALQIKKIVEDNQLGTVMLSPWAVNPHHNGDAFYGEAVHKVRTCVWTVNLDRYEDWCKGQEEYIAAERERKYW